MRYCKCDSCERSASGGAKSLLRPQSRVCSTEDWGVWMLKISKWRVESFDFELQKRGAQEKLESKYVSLFKPDFASHRPTPADTSAVGMFVSKWL